MNKKNLLVVDKKDNILLKETRKKCHTNEGILHRAVTIFIFDDYHNLLITRRSKNKKLWPECWESSCSTHVYEGETYEQAGERRLPEELGFRCKLSSLFKFKYKARYKNIGSENEICVLLVGNYRGKITPNPKEVSDYKWISINKLNQEINKKIYTPWLRIALRKYRKGKKSLKKISYQQRLRYFDKLRETSALIDLYVKQFTGKYIQLSSELKSKILKRFRFRKAKLRPAQIRLAYELVGGKEWEEIIPACASVEVCDTGYYCADDVFDEGVKSKDMFIASHLLSSIAHAMMCEMAKQTTKSRFQEIIKTLNRLDGDIYQGFYIDLDMINKTDTKYYMKKAYAYNYWEHILKIGALLGGANSENTKKIAEIGKNIGIAYTIANDTCDFGKPKCSDFALGKRTLPILFALKKSSKNDKRILKSLIGKGSFSKKQIDIIRTIMVNCGAIKYGKSKAIKYCEKAFKILNDFPDSEAKELLKFATTMTQKNKYYDILEKYRR